MDELRELRQRRAEEWKKAREAGDVPGNDNASTRSRTDEVATPPNNSLGLMGIWNAVRSGNMDSVLNGYVEDNPQLADISAAIGLPSAGSSRAGSSQRPSRDAPAPGAQPEKQAGEVNHDDQQAARCCRICFDSQETAETGPLFSPCRCAGSMRFVHVECLNSWRAAAQNEKSYYKCDQCHYEYRIERVRAAALLTSKDAQQLLTVVLFISSACVLGCLALLLYPGLLDYTADWLDLPPSARLLLTAEVTDGNAGCWYGGATYQSCCAGRGHSACWGGHRSFEVCCAAPAAEWQQHLRRTCVPLFRLFAAGSIGLSCVGFAIYVMRSVCGHWHDGNGMVQAGLFIAWICHFSSKALGRIVAVVGSAVAIREVYALLQNWAKRLASRIGDRVLAVS